uniref:Cytochrome b5 heme-binding domain-containing protein n=1 Tax=Heterorhabditis bacteriophora TaxID=37862 RepID=A0A1I7WFV7_HETBA
MSLPEVNRLFVKPSVNTKEYGRVKIALPVGRSLMDWVRLTSGKFIAKKRLNVIDHTELIKHNTKEDCWIHIFGQVYDVTSYLDFHPGGVDELMRAAGRDGTALFNQYHAWVNYESMLKACFVGRFRGDLSKCFSISLFKTIVFVPPTEPRMMNESNSLASSTEREITRTLKTTPLDLGINVSVNANSISLSSPEWISLQSANIVIDTSMDNFLRILVRHFQQPPVELIWDILDGPHIHTPTLSSISVHRNEINIKLDASESSVDQSCLTDKKCWATRKPVLKYHRYQVSDVRNVSHDTLLYTLAHPHGLHLSVPPGQHIFVRIMKGG